MTSGWTFDAEPPVRDSELTTIVDQTSFCISDKNGDVNPTSVHGLFFQDTRILSTWKLVIDDSPIESLAVDNPEPYTANFVGRAHLSPEKSGTIIVERRRYVGNGMREDIVIKNVTSQELTINVRIALDADFADIFEVKERRVAPTVLTETTTSDHAIDITRQGSDHHGIRLTAAAPGTPTWGDRSVSYALDIPGRGDWRARFSVQPISDNHATPPTYSLDMPIHEAPPAIRTHEWNERSPSMTSPDTELVHTFNTSKRDIGSLRIFDPTDPSTAAIAAGAPWFMALYGRDSLLSALMTLPLDPSLAQGTLRALARYQGTTDDTLTEEEEGKILHEMRLGADAKHVLGGREIYYGSVDATPLFVVLLGELHRWGGLAEEDLNDLLPAADRALGWIQRKAEQAGDSFLRYKRSSDHGLINQGWKDTWDGVTFADGRLAEAPIALCEVQGYVYAAYTARAHLAKELGDHAGELRWRQAADNLRNEFNRRFWMEDHGWYALALDRDNAQVDALTSNIGHCLWSGIVDPEKAQLVADRLMSPEMFSGWGIRTLATSMKRYSPMGYGMGTVYPHDNAIIAAGLMRYGFVAEATRVTASIFDAAEYFNGQLPELFCGFDRAEFDRPIPYPAACAPQAWAAAAPIYLLRTLLRLDPSVPQGTVRLDPVIPDRMLPLRLKNVPLGSGRLTIDVQLCNFSIDSMPEGLTLYRP